MSERYCIVIPHYRHDRQLAEFLPNLARAQLPALIVDDGSDPACLKRLRSLAAQYPWVELLTREHNGGKGAATVTGLVGASDQGFSHVILVDADGQHDPQAIVALHSASLQAPCLLYTSDAADE